MRYLLLSPGYLAAAAAIVWTRWFLLFSVGYAVGLLAAGLYVRRRLSGEGDSWEAETFRTVATDALPGWRRVATRGGASPNEALHAAAKFLIAATEKSPDEE